MPDHPAADTPVSKPALRPVNPAPDPPIGGGAEPPDPVWEIRQDDATLTGTVNSVEWNAGPVKIPDIWHSGDGDWVINITPAPASAAMAYNLAGIHNFAPSEHADGDPAEGTIQCEIQPGNNGQDLFNALVGDLTGHTVTITGPFVEDTKHHNRTEIHPLTTLRFDSAAAAVGSVGTRFLAFSDASQLTNFHWGKTAYPPHAHTDRVATCAIAWSPRPAAPATAVFDFYDLSPGTYQSADTERAGDPSAPVLNVTVHTGTPDDGKGTYAGAFFLRWQLRVLTVTVSPDPLPLDKPVQVLVTAADAATGVTINGAAVLFDSQAVGITGTPFQYTFTSHLVVEDPGGDGDGPRPIGVPPRRVRVPPDITAVVNADQYQPAALDLPFPPNGY